jgi:hypothetical protein
MAATSITPVLFTYWFIEQVQSWNNDLNIFENIMCNWNIGIGYLIATAALVLIFLIIVSLAKSQLEVLKISIEEIKTADNETVSFIIVYLLPLANGVTENLNIPILIFVAIFFFFIVLSTNSYHFNPLINLVGYHFYEAKVKGGITYILLSRKNVSTSKSIKEVYHLTEYMILEKN